MTNFQEPELFKQNEFLNCWSAFELFILLTSFLFVNAIYAVKGSNVSRNINTFSYALYKHISIDQFIIPNLLHTRRTFIKIRCGQLLTPWQVWDPAFLWLCDGVSWNFACLNPGGGGVRPYMGYIGMCGLKGYRFSAVLVINRVSIGYRCTLVFNSFFHLRFDFLYAV